MAELRFAGWVALVTGSEAGLGRSHANFPDAGTGVLVDLSTGQHGIHRLPSNRCTAAGLAHGRDHDRPDR
jgi:hypothetical protein